MRALLPFTLLLAAALLPLVAADAAFDGGAPLGRASLFLELVGAPVPSAGTPMQVRLRTDAPEPPEMRLVPPAGEPEAWRPMVEVEGLWTAPVLFAQAGAWGVEVRAGGDTAAFSFDVWPPARAWIVPEGEAASRGVLLAGGRETLGLRLIDASGHPLPAPADALVRIEGPDGGATVPLLAEDGVLTLERPWDRPGSYLLHVTSASSGLPEGARPALPLLVVSADQAAVYGLEQKDKRDVPLGPFLVPAALAAAFGLLARRR